jgi:hypothetical protein
MVLTFKHFWWINFVCGTRSSDWNLVADLLEICLGAQVSHGRGHDSEELFDALLKLGYSVHMCELVEHRS